VTDYTDVTPNNVAQMKAALNKQPLAVAIEADKLCFQTYKSGVFSNAKCGTTLDHAVLAVGYGTENGQDYWLVKNSWNTTWGDNGYIKLAVTGDDAGICGVQSDPEFPTTNL
jgi:C1A family cysteine protease